MKKFGCIYLITNKVTGKQYIGQTINTIEFRFSKHACKKVNSAIHKAIVKYGKDNFVIEEIASCFSMDAMNALEEDLIKAYNTLSPNGYNLISGGRNRIPCEELRKAHSKKIKGMSYPSRQKWIKATSIDSLTTHIFKGYKAGIQYGFTPGLVRKCLCGQRFKHADFTFSYLNQANQSGSAESNTSTHAQRLEIETAKAE